MSRRVPLPGLLLAAAALSLLPWQPPAMAQFSLSGEVGLRTGLRLASRAERFSETVSVLYSAHLEAELDLAPVLVRVVLDPAFGAPGPAAGTPAATALEPLFEPGLTEAFVLLRQGNVDLSAGIERLPLEVARLSRPYGIEDSGETGLPRGLPSVRASIFLGSWRIRPVVFYKDPLGEDPQPGGVLSVRRDFTSFELEAHVVYLDGIRVGLSGSGLVGDLVLYGEAWLLTGPPAELSTAPLGGRGALGLSGFLGDALWTIEAAYAPLPLGGLPTPAPQLLGQLDIPQGDEGSWQLSAGAALTDSLLRPGEQVVQAQAGLGYSLAGSDYLFRVGPSVTHTELATIYGLSLEVKGFF